MTRHHRTQVTIRALSCVFGAIICLTSAQAGEIGGWLEADAVRLKPLELGQVDRCIRATEKLELEPSRGPTDNFALLFGGDRGTDVLGYLRERIRFLGKDTEEDLSDPNSAGTYASNYGPSWLEFHYRKEVLGHVRARPTSAPFRQGSIPILSPRTGLVVLGSAFTAKETTDFDRMETLVHEARHSDCAAVPSRSDLDAYMNEKYLEMSDEGRACTNVHMPCPRGHALSGELACDTHPWGAYMAGYVFAEEVFKRCRGCTERERQQALATAKEDFTRLSPELRERLRNGTLPSPLMESVN